MMPLFLLMRRQQRSAARGGGCRASAHWRSSKWSSSPFEIVESCAEPFSSLFSDRQQLERSEGLRVQGQRALAELKAEFEALTSELMAEGQLDAGAASQAAAAAAQARALPGGQNLPCAMSCRLWADDRTRAGLSLLFACVMRHAVREVACFLCMFQHGTRRRLHCYDIRRLELGDGSMHLHVQRRPRQRQGCCLVRRQPE